MFEDIIQTVTEQAKANEFLQGGFILAVLATLGMYCRSIPRSIWEFIKKYSLVSLEFRQNDDLFDWFMQYLESQKAIEKKLCLRIHSKKIWETNEDGEEVSNIKFFYSLGFGTFFIRIKGLWLSLTRSSGDGKGPEGGTSEMGINAMLSAMAGDYITLRVFRWQRKRLEATIMDIHELVQEEKKVAPNYIYFSGYAGWDSYSEIPERALKTVVLAPGVKESIVKRIDEFLARRNWCAERGLPWQLGISLPGPHGTGKSSLIHALATHYKKHICILSLGDEDVTDKKLGILFSRAPKDSLVVCEDIDTFIDPEDPRKMINTKVTFSGFVNAIGGIAMNPGRIFIITSNKADKFDPTMIRDGRIDFEEILGYADAEQARRMFELFYPEDLNLADKFEQDFKLGGRPGQPACIQNHFIDYRFSAQDALDNINGIFTREQRKSLSFSDLSIGKEGGNGKDKTVGYGEEKVVRNRSKVLKGATQ